MKTLFEKLSVVFGLALFTFCYSYNVLAAPGTLAQAPLFLRAGVSPNVFLTLDNSTSMYFEALLDDGTVTNTRHGVYKPVGSIRTRPYLYKGFNPANRTMAPGGVGVTLTGVNDLGIFRNHIANGVYYNPNITYTPWIGQDADGNNFEDATANKAWQYPNVTTGTFADLTVEHQWNNDSGSKYRLSTYYNWDDKDSDGNFDSGEFAKVEIKPSVPTYTHDVPRSDCGNTTTCTYDQEMQNFANWWVYYRSRNLAAKAAVGNLINSASGANMGLHLIHDDNAITFEAVSIDDPDKKLELLQALYSNYSLESGTPLQSALHTVGKYFAGELSNQSTPITSSCQSNYNILVTDGYWTNNYSGVDNEDGDNNTDFDSNLVAPYGDGQSGTLADVAMKYYENDLLPSLADDVPTTTADPASHQHLVTYGIAFGLTGQLTPGVDDPTDPGFNWPTPVAVQKTTIDDLWHATYNSRGEFLSAGDSDALKTALEDMLLSITNRGSGSASSASVSSSQVTAGSTIYRTSFDSDGWHGTVNAYGLDEDSTTGLFTLKTTGIKSAANELVDNNSRVILTKSSDGIEFQWTNLTGDMKADLNTGPDGTSDGKGMDRLAYIRGDHSNEGTGNGKFRQRATMGNGKTSRLGDIVHSSATFVGTPNVGWSDAAPFPTGGNAYSKFLASITDDPDTNAVEGRTAVIYAGANDGMLHGFNSETLEEVLAYIPSNLFSTSSGEGLHYLTEQDYSHRYYVDLTPSVSDVYINGSWRTVLIGGQRAGGKGYFALDITDPGSFTTANAADIVMWEFTHPDLGYTYSQPQIGMMNDGTWVAIFGNGYNNDGSGEAELFIVDIATGGLIKQISTGASAETNGLATPALADLDQNGTIDRAYAGDLEGNMWAFDLSGSASSAWVLDYKLINAGGEPITSKPILSFHPSEITITSPSNEANVPNVMVFFGTGQFLVDSDLSTGGSTYNYFGGVWDKSSTTVSSSDLVEQTISTGTYDGTVYRYLTKNPVDYTGDTPDLGWKIKLPDSGERIITNPAVRAGTIFFNSSIPSGGGCGSGGSGYRFRVDLATGGTPNTPEFDVDKNGVLDENDKINDSVFPGAKEVRDSMPTAPTPAGDHDLVPEPDPLLLIPSPETGRFSWQELLH